MAADAMRPITLAGREMEDLFKKQAKLYEGIRPSYPPDLFQFIASKTPGRDLVWDVGTGNGQAALPLAGIYKNVVATDTSQEQLSLATKLPNIRYQQTPPNMSIAELERDVATHATVDVVTIAEAAHWFDLHSFYQQVNWVLKKPHGLIALWGYPGPQVDDRIDAIYSRIYKEADWAPARKLLDHQYRNIYFPFKAVEGTDHTGPFHFETTKSMDLDAFLNYIRSWSAYQTAREKGVEILKEDVIKEFEHAWGEDGRNQKVVRFPIYLRIGRVGTE